MRTLLTAFLVLGLAVLAAAAGPEPNTVGAAYPYLCAGALSHAVISELEEHVFVSTSYFTITKQELDKEISNSPKSIQEQVRKYPIYLLEQIAQRKLIAVEAVDWAAQNEKKGKLLPEALVNGYLAAKVPRCKATEREAEDFYNEHAALFNKAPFSEIKDYVKAYVEDDRTVQARDRFVADAGKRHKIRISALWLKSQVETWSANPVEQARVSGKPSLVTFSVIGCCDRMHPIVEELKATYAGKLNVVFVHVGEQDVLAELYGVGSIPVEFFFDKDGKEFLRHQGFLSKEQILAKCADHGIDLAGGAK